MRLKGSCHCGKVRFEVDSTEAMPFMRCYCEVCRKTAGAGGFAINLGAAVAGMKVHGQRHLRVYRARLDRADGRRKRLSPARRYFCAHCGSALWVWDPRWPDLVHPHAGAIDTPLPSPPSLVHIMLGSKAGWVAVEGGADDARFERYPDFSLADWHRRHGG
jgi:hypothetical protein